MNPPWHKYYDSGKDRLVFIGSAADEGYWDSHWERLPKQKLYKPQPPRFNYILRATQRHLAPGSLVLESGCGLAQNSWYLYLLGYRPVALDFAPRTVQYLKRTVPEVNPVLGDVRSIPLRGASVDGCWSIGVIEHFYEGYGRVRDEIHRVLKPGGILFVTFPRMSGIRRLKRMLNLYPAWDESRGTQDFYQFALNQRSVLRDFRSLGFETLGSWRLEGFKGFKDEVGFLHNPLQRIYDNRSIPGKVASRSLDLLGRTFASHAALLILRKLNTQSKPAVIFR